MTNEEFEAMLAVDGYEVYTSVQYGFGSVDENVYLARVVAPVLPTDTSQGPYRNPGMTRTVLEATSVTSCDDAMAKLIQLYSGGR